MAGRGGARGEAGPTFRVLGVDGQDLAVGLVGLVELAEALVRPAEVVQYRRLVGVDRAALEAGRFGQRVAKQVLGRRQVAVEHCERAQVVEQRGCVGPAAVLARAGSEPVSLCRPLERLAVPRLGHVDVELLVEADVARRARPGRTHARRLCRRRRRVVGVNQLLDLVKRRAGARAVGQALGVRQARVSERKQGRKRRLDLGLVGPAPADALKRVLGREVLALEQLHLAGAEVGYERRVSRLGVGQVVHGLRVRRVGLHVVHARHRVDATEKVRARVGVRHRALGQLERLE